MSLFTLSSPFLTPVLLSLTLPLCSGSYLALLYSITSNLVPLFISTPNGSVPANSGVKMCLPVHSLRSPSCTKHCSRIFLKYCPCKGLSILEVAYKWVVYLFIQLCLVLLFAKLTIQYSCLCMCACVGGQRHGS